MQFLDNRLYNSKRFSAKFSTYIFEGLVVLQKFITRISKSDFFLITIHIVYFFLFLYFIFYNTTFLLEYVTIWTMGVFKKCTIFLANFYNFNLLFNISQQVFKDLSISLFINNERLMSLKNAPRKMELSVTKRRTEK